MKDIPGVTKFGTHGYDNMALSMQAVFMANGPRFAKGVTIDSMQNIDLYHLFAKLLNIEEFAANLDLDGVNRKDIWKKMLQTRLRII